MPSVEDFIKDISDRHAAIQKQTSAESIKTLILEALKDLPEDDEIVRKMRFGSADPALVGSKFGRWGLDAGDIEFLYDFQIAAKAKGMSGGPSEELTKAFHAVSDAYYMSEEEIQRIDRRALDDIFPRIPKSGLNPLALQQTYERATRAMDTAEAGFGAELMGAQYQRELWEAARTESRIFGLIDTFEMTDGSAYLPVEVNLPEPIFVGESTTFNATNYATVKTGSQRVLVTAKKILWHQMWSRELEEDSIIPFVPFLRRQMMLSLAHYSDALIMNGDTTNTATGNINLDDADPADTKYYLAFDGIRHGAIVDNTANHVTSAGAVSLTSLRDLRGLMMDATNLVDWGHPTDFNDLIFVADPETADRIALLDEVVSAKIQREPALLLNGEIARIIGHPVISSMAVSKTEADGKLSTTGANNILGQVVAFNRRGFKVGWRRRLRVETESLPGTDQARIVYSARLGFGRFTPTGAASGIESVAVKSNITL